MSIVRSPEDKSSQAAMEFLTTYAWVIVVVIIVIACLVYFGLLNPDRYLPDRIDLNDKSLNMVSMGYGIFGIKNTGEAAMYNVSLNFTRLGCTESPPKEINPGQMKYFMVLCRGLTEKTTRLKSDFTIRYTLITEIGIYMAKIATGYAAVTDNFKMAGRTSGSWLLEGNYNDYSPVLGQATGYRNARVENDAAYFNGIGDYLSIPDDDRLDPTIAVTVSAWVKFSELPRQYGTFVSKWCGAGDCNGGKDYRRGYYLQLMSNGKMRFGVGFGDEDWYAADSADSFSDGLGMWHHVLGTYNSRDEADNMRLYVDGKLEAKATYKKAMDGESTQPLYIGMANEDEGQYFGGAVRDVMVIGSSLDSDEANALYRYGQD